MLLTLALALPVLADSRAREVVVEGDPGSMVSPADDCISLWIGEEWARAGDEIWVPIYVQDVTGWGVLAVEMTICWCDVPAGLLQYVRCEPGEVIENSGWGIGFCNPCSPNCVSISYAGPEPLIGGGVLGYLVFHVSANAKPCMCCDVWFDTVNLYDPEKPLAVCLTDGWVCIEYCTIGGWINYWKCCYDDCDEPYLVKPLPGTFVHLNHSTQGPVASTYTDRTGYYQFACVEPLDPGGPSYCVDVDMCPIVDCVTAYDASMVLRYLVCMEELTDCMFISGDMPYYPQQVAADVNCSGLITAYDASLILQYVVGLIDVFPCPDAWSFFPLSCSGCVNDCVGPYGLDWIGVMRGDVSGCPECPPSAVGSVGPAKVKLTRASHYTTDSGDKVKTYVKIRNAQDIWSMEFEVAFDDQNLSVESVSAVGQASGFMGYGHPHEGILSIAFAGMAPFSGNGKVVEVIFSKIGGRVPTLDGRISLEDALLNEGTPEAVVQDYDGTAETHRILLGPAAPNPFSTSTTIAFSMASPGRVSLEIYNVEGRLVRTLVDGYVEAGPHTIAWDGTDSSGSRVARGIYFCHMKSEGFSSTNKLVVIQ
jgi:hypothetical protein